MSVDKFFLQMKSHSKQVFSVLRELYDSSSLTDVTLLCEGHYFGAHRLVLSACSPYFRTLFTTIPDKHPVIFMKGVKKTEMIDILDFMYNGEVTISHTQLASFLQIADELSVNGLTKGLQNEDGGEEPGNPEPSLDKYTVKRRRISCSETTEDNKRKVPHTNEDTDEEPTQQELNEILPHLDLNNAGESIEVLIDKDSNPNLKIIPNHKDNGDLMLDNLEVSRDQQFNKSRIIETDIKEEIESPDNTSQMKKEVSRPCVPPVDVMLSREAVPPPKVPSNSDARQEAPNVRLLSHWAVEPGDSGIPGVSLPAARGMVPGGIPPFSGSSGGGPGCVSVSGSGGGTGAYQCPVCGKMCNAKHHLTYHLRTHTGERPYRCDVCGLTFSQQSNMYRHKRTKHVGVSGEGRGLVDGQGYAMVNIE